MRIFLSTLIVLCALTRAAADDGFMLALPTPPGWQFWEQVEDGAVSAAEATGRNLTTVWAGHDIVTQFQQIEATTVGDFAGVAIGPVNPAALSDALAAALAAGERVVFIDAPSGVDGVPTVGIDSIAAGAAAGSFICSRIDQGEVAVLFNPSAPAQVEMAGGAADALRACGLTVIDELPEGPPVTPESALETYLNQHADLDAIIAVGSEIASAVVENLERNGRLSDVTVAAIGQYGGTIQMIAEGKLAGVVAFNDRRLGELAVETLIRLENRETVEQFIEAGTTLVTNENTADFQ